MISFFVPGKPIPQGSAKAFNVGGIARVVTGAQSESTPLGGWRARIAGFAALNYQKPPFDGEVKINVTFFFDRPKSLFKKPRAAATSRRCGDIDKLLRSVLDGLTGVIYLDDSQVTLAAPEKVYVGNPDNYAAAAGALITIFLHEDGE